jgi:hypothetical protein
MSIAATTSIPNAPGWYWYECAMGSAVAHVFRAADGQLAQRTPYAFGNGPIASMGRSWGDRIHEPAPGSLVRQVPTNNSVVTGMITFYTRTAVVVLYRYTSPQQTCCRCKRSNDWKRIDTAVPIWPMIGHWKQYSSYSPRCYLWRHR